MDALDATFLSASTRSNPTTTVFLQDACLQHKYIRTRDSSHIVERPERLRAVKIGLCAAISRLEETLPPTTNVAASSGASETDSLIEAIENLKLEQNPVDFSLPKGHPVQVVQSSAKVDILNHPAVKFIHGDIDRDVYLEKLIDWARDSMEKISHGQCEIPSELPQGDMYMCPTSLDAIQGALGTVCEAVDTVMTSPAPGFDPPRTAFVAIRPPGHHCGEDTPCGFCFVNNVAVGAAHAHLKHGIKRVVILDIDLHHGHGTQSIVWQINEEAYRTRSEAESGAPSEPGIQVYYGSVHDILSFPCEDGKPDMVQAASVSIHGPHGQYIENIHLEPFESEEQFWDVHYREAYSKLLMKAEDFVKRTGGASDDTFVFISAGFDASEYETPSMSRHNRKVPTSFFYRFTQDVCEFANKWANGRVVSVLEGGYSDKALLSGAMAHLTGLVDGECAAAKDNSRENWWSSENVQILEKLVKKRRGPIPSVGTADAKSTPWFDRTAALLAVLDPRSAESSSTRGAFALPSPMTLRARQPAIQGALSTSPAMSPDRTKVDQNRPSGGVAVASSSPESTPETSPPTVTKKLPRVILRVGPRPET
ncbi:histone deacetylase domain-containing protein [Lactifluus subvellereus]|nr:histone deacetylase domain-containing protein [Lactifluus subvellereus]